MSEDDCLFCIQSGSAQQQLSADAAAVGNIASHAASEAADHVPSAAGTQGVINYQLPTGHVSSVNTQPNVTPSQQPAATDVYAHQTELG